MPPLLAIVALAVHLVAQPDALPGRYALDPRTSDDVVAVVDAAVRDVSRLKRGRVRSELLEQLRPSPSITIRAEPNGFVIADSAGRELPAYLDAPATRITTPKGEAATVEASVQGTALVMRVKGPRAVRQQVFTVDAARLMVTSTYVVDALDSPITLRTTYRRVTP